MEDFCRACLNKFNDSSELLQYCESNRRLFVYCTGIQVKRNDTFTFQLCKECYLNLKFACKFKKQCRTSDKRFQCYLALKKGGENINLDTYLKNIEDTLSLRLPVVSRGNSPVHQKNDDDDDNVSTCTSIQNFMSDILQGEEMLPTEARIVREVIQEEADILDDSLDSHWLQDDNMSVDNDFGMDFNFTGLSTPHSINNDHCYTPRRLTNDRENDTYFYNPDDNATQLNNTQMVHNNDMPLLDIAEKNKQHTGTKLDQNNTVQDNVKINTPALNDMSFHTDCDIKLDGIVEDYEFMTMDDLENGNLNSSVKPNNENITIIVNKGVAPKVTVSPLADEFEFYMENVHNNNESSIKISDNNVSQNNIVTIANKSNGNVINQLSNIESADVYQTTENIDSPLKCELDKYINKVELKRKFNEPSRNEISKNRYGKCSIDRNLEMALKNNSQEFFLEQLLVSPQESIRSGASTPTINNILFGEFTPRESGVIDPDLPAIAVEQNPQEPVDFIEEFLKDDCRPESTPIKEAKNEERTFIKVKDLSKLKGSKEIRRKIIKGDLTNEKLKKSKHKKDIDSNRGYKDINRLKKLMKSDKENQSETSDVEMLDSEQEMNQNVDIEGLVEFQNHNETFSESLDSESSLPYNISDSFNNYDVSQSQTESHDNTALNGNVVTEQSQEIIESTIHLAKSIDDDLDISLSNLLDFDDNQSIDLNVSIASDFLKEDKLDEDKEANDTDSIFKVPLSPPDNKYDLDKNLCKICNKTFSTRGALKTHFFNIHKQQLPKVTRKKEPKICPTCGKEFYDTSNFNRHVYRQHKVNNIRCKYCTLEFPTQGRFNLHIRAHASEIAEEKKRDLAAKNETIDTLKEKDDLPAIGNRVAGNEKEDRTVTEDTSNKENDTAKKDVDNVATTINTEDDTVIKEKEVTAAKEKDVNAITEKDLDNDENKDDKDGNEKKRKKGKKSPKKKTYVCTLCGKELKTSGNYNVHLRRHNKVYTVKCEICDKGFVRKYDLDVHMHNHGSEKLFECQYCDKKYKTRHLLIGHMYRHLGKEKFRCDICDRNFISIQNLKQHHQTQMCKNNRMLALQEEVDSKDNIKDLPLPNEVPKVPEKVIECPERGEYELQEEMEIKEEIISLEINTEAADSEDNIADQPLPNELQKVPEKGPCPERSEYELTEEIEIKEELLSLELPTKAADSEENITDQPLPNRPPKVTEKVKECPERGDYDLHEEIEIKEEFVVIIKEEDDITEPSVGL